MSANKLFTSTLVVALMVTLVAALVPAAPAAAQEGTTGQRTVTVTGYGTAYGAPDIVTVGLGVEASDSDIMAAMDAVTQRMNQVIDMLESEGIASEDIRTEHFSIYQDYYGGPSPMSEGDRPAPIYRVSTGLNVTVRQTDRVGQLLSQAVAAGANLVNYINFDIEDRSGLQADARTNAVADARDRAQQLADILGMTVGEALEVTENTEQFFGVQARGLGGGAAVPALDAAPIREGQLSVSVAVTITFQLLPAS